LVERLLSISCAAFFLGGGRAGWAPAKLKFILKIKNKKKPSLKIYVSKNPSYSALSLFILFISKTLSPLFHQNNSKTR